MKKIILPFVLFISTAVMSQRFAVVDLKTILEKMPQFQSINSQINILTKVWEGEIYNKEQRIKKLKEEYQQEELFYTETIKQKKVSDIENAEKEVYELSKKYFGYEGELFKKRQEMVKPLQDRIYEIIQRVARERVFDLVIDKSAGSYILYMEPKVDITTRVLQLLGL